MVHTILVEISEIDFNEVKDYSVDISGFKYLKKDIQERVIKELIIISSKNED